MIRRMEPADRAPVTTIQEQLEHADPELVDRAIDGPFLGLVAVVDGRVVGYAVALPGPSVALSELAVVPEARRHGHGRALVESLSGTDTDRIVVTTPVEARAARAFYGALGFERAAVLDEFYADGGDALRLTRRE